MENKYIVSSVGEWNKNAFNKFTSKLKGDWFYCSTPSELDKLLVDISPRYIFFPHWRWIVPENIINYYECICFHMTDVPYGRGGSPLQNLIVRGHKETILTALRMETGLDTGPVYYKKSLSLEGTASEIYQRATELSWKMIGDFVKREPLSTPQKGEVVVFSRRTPEESKIPDNLDLEKIYDYIRMLDAPSYPKAFIEFGKYRLEFDEAEFNQDGLTATVRFKEKE